MKLALCRTSYTKLYSFFSEKNINKRDVQVPYSLMLLAGHVQKIFGDSVDIKIFDGEVGVKSQDILVNGIINWEPNLIGFTTTTPEIDNILNICKILKEKLPNCVTILGGAHVSGVKTSIAPPHIDYVVMGEGEYPLEKIIKEQSYQKQKIKNKTEYIAGDNVDLGSTGDPSYSVINLENYYYTDPLNGFIKTNTVTTVRGCPHRCKFCFANRYYRKRDINRAIDEIKYLYNNGVRHIIVNDETLTENKARFFEFTDKIIELGYEDLIFLGLTRVDRIDSQIVDRLVEANFRRINIGVESGSDHILKIINKDITVDKVKRAVCLLRKRKELIVRGSFMLGLPYETNETISQTIELAKELDIQFGGFNIVMPYPGTKLYDMAMSKEGLEFVIDTKSDSFYSEFRRWGNCIIRTPELSTEDLLAYQKKAINEFYSQPRIINFYQWTFQQGNKEKFWHRPLNHVYRQIHGRDLNYWGELN